MNACPICETEDSLDDVVSWSDFEYKGVTKRLPLLYSLCKSCGSEVACYEQTVANKATMTGFRKEVENES